MVKDNTSPEERLLAAIEKGDKAVLSRAKEKKFLPDIEFLIGHCKERILSFAAFLTKGGDADSSFDMIHVLKVVNRGIGVLAAVLLLALIIDMIFPSHQVTKIYANTSRSHNWETQKKKVIALEAFTVYQDAVRKRDIFNPVTQNVSASAGIGKTAQFQEITKDLSLVGIYWGASPEAMIEDTAAKKTYFLKRGDEVKGIIIKEILKDRVVLQYRNEEIELM